MSKKPFVSQNNLFSSKNLFEKEEDNISLKSNDIISFSYEIDNLNKNESGKVNFDNFVTFFLLISLSYFLYLIDISALFIISLIVAFFIFSRYDFFIFLFSA